MIRSCEDVKTLEEFHKFSNYRFRMIDIGLLETANMIAWNQRWIICPELIDNLVNKNYRVKDD